jgi:hypothetical protein
MAFTQNFRELAIGQLMDIFMFHRFDFGFSYLTQCFISSSNQLLLLTATHSFEIFNPKLSQSFGLLEGQICWNIN